MVFFQSSQDIFPFNLIIKPVKVRAFFIASFVAIFIPAMFGATKLEPQTSAEQFLPESHPFQRFVTASNYFLASNQDETVSMQIAYGFNVDEPMNLDGVNRLFNPVRSSLRHGACIYLI